MLHNPSQSTAYDEFKLDNGETLPDSVQSSLDQRCDELEAALLDMNRQYKGKRSYTAGRVIDAEVSADASGKGRLSLVIEGLDLGLEVDDWLEALRWAVRNAKCLPKEPKPTAYQKTQAVLADAVKAGLAKSIEQIIH